VAEVSDDMTQSRPFLRRVARDRCSSCGGWDVGAAGFIHHAADCPRNPCFFCGRSISPGEKRSTCGPAKRPCHLDCLVDSELSPAAETEGEDGDHGKPASASSSAGDLSEHLDQSHDADEGRPWI
jgi:hypothetical protein